MVTVVALISRCPRCHAKWPWCTCRPEHHREHPQPAERPYVQAKVIR
jgi:hypothetical protein